MSLHLEIDHERVAEFCRRNPIERLAFFGSVLRNDFGPDSDVGVLVEFTPQAQVTLIDMVRMQDELSEIIGCRVDLRTKGLLSRYFRDVVVAEAEVEFVADLDDEMRWDEVIEKTHPGLAEAARKAKREKAAGQATPLDFDG